MLVNIVAIRLLRYGLRIVQQIVNSIKTFKNRAE